MVKESKQTFYAHYIKWGLSIKLFPQYLKNTRINIKTRSLNYLLWASHIIQFIIKEDKCII